MANGLLTWQKYGNPITVIGIKECCPEFTLKLVKMIVNNNDKIFTITKSADETTIIIDEELDDFYDWYIYKEKYVAYILLNTSDFVEESGLLKKISTHLADFKIPIMYVTTVNNNYLFIPKSYESKADEILKYGIPY